MGRFSNTNISIGTRGNPQTSFEQCKYEKTIQGIKIDAIKIAYSREKMEDYLLNLNHPHGFSKAKFFKEVLGYESGDGVLLNERISNAANGSEPISTEQTEFGLKQGYRVRIKSKDGTKEATVRVIVQKDNGSDFFKIITAFPDKEDDK